MLHKWFLTLLALLIFDRHYKLLQAALLWLHMQQAGARLG
jgi:hypothetical protein